MELIDGPPEVASDHVPSVDQKVPIATYRDWKHEDTRIITCAIANDVYPGRRFESRSDARATIERTYGVILEANYTPGRAFFRVFKKVP